MKLIHKNNAPQELTDYCRCNPLATYEEFTKERPIYHKVKKCLADEQGYICCYCGRRITGISSDTQIEHIFAKGTPDYEEMQLDYETNFLACCDGGKSNRAKGIIPKCDLFCEAVKRNKILPINPLNPLCESKFLFSPDGQILGIAKDAEVTIKMLNLTSAVIKNMRKAAIENYSFSPPANWNEELHRLQQKDCNGMFEEFSFVLEKYIEIYQLQTI
jgi:uncharacterized protein (TIGR02646 family)